MRFSVELTGSSLVDIANGSPGLTGASPKVAVAGMAVGSDIKKTRPPRKREAETLPK